MVDLSQGLLCGGYTHEIIYVSGPKLDTGLTPVNADLSSFTLNELSPTRIDMVGSVNDFSWLGKHKIVIKSTNGKVDLSQEARGA